jgi:hypothetical protein
MVGMQHPGQQVRVNLADLQVGSVVFHAAVTDTWARLSARFLWTLRSTK